MLWLPKWKLTEVTPFYGIPMVFQCGWHRDNFRPNFNRSVPLQWERCCFSRHLTPCYGNQAHILVHKYWFLILHINNKKCKFLVKNPNYSIISRTFDLRYYFFSSNFNNLNYFLTEWHEIWLKKYCCLEIWTLKK